MKLTACYIVGRNEIGFEKSLQSIQGQVDEIVIVMTQKDGEVQSVAEKYHCRVFYFAWEEDFSKARNFALEKATGDWIVFLDADEYFPMTNAENLRSVIEANINNSVDLDQIFIKRLDIDPENNNEVLADFFVAKIFRHMDDIFYKGRIHEELCTHDGRELKSVFIGEEELFLYHTGYAKTMGPQKAARNLKILLEDVEQAEDPTAFYMYIAEAYEGVGDVQAAIKYARLDVAKNRRRPITYASRSYRLLFRLLSVDSQIAENDILSIAAKSVQDFPELPEFWAQYAVYLAQAFRYDEAVYMMKKGIKSFAEYRSIEPSDFTKEDQATGEHLIASWNEIKALEGSLRISACVITKNEAEELPRWIANMKQCSDEQILIDTGSDDATVDIAKAAGVKVFPYAWNGDFSQVRNAAIEKATGDWIIFLDADEYFSPETVGNVRHIIAREHLRVDEVDVIFLPIVNIDVDNDGHEIQRFINIRLFRNLPELRYRGNVHESIRREGAPLRVLSEKHKLLVYHTGYSAKRILRKLQRNLELLQADIARNGEKIQHYRYLMDCYYGLGQYKKAIQYGKKHIESPVVSFCNDSDVYRKLVFSKQALLFPSQEILAEIDQAIEKFPQLPDFYAIKGAFLNQCGKIGLAEKYLLQAMQVYKNSSEQIEATMFKGDLPQIQYLLNRIKQKKFFGGFLTEEQGKEIMAENANILAGLEQENRLVQHIVIRWQDAFRTAFYILAERKGKIVNEQSFLQRCENILPKSMYHCLLRYTGYIVCLRQTDYDGHISLYQLAAYDQGPFFKAYLNACLDFPSEQKKEILQQLFYNGLIAQTEELLFSFSKEEIDDTMLYYYGICCYNQGRLHEAKVYFDKIKQEASYRTGAESYLYWIKEREGRK